MITSIKRMCWFGSIAGVLTKCISESSDVMLGADSQSQSQASN